MAAVKSRYARALVDVVFDKKMVPGRVREQLQSVLDTLNNSIELRRVWENPSVPTEQKTRLLDAIGAQLGLDAIVRNFIAVLIRHQRIGMLGQIVDQFESEINTRLGIAEAEITSARQLGTEEREAMESQIARMTGKQVRAKYATNGALLGGAVVRVGSTVYDGSVRGQIDKLKEVLTNE
jgi:F-type H+-transporting ATPase subunit delta